MWLLRQIHYPSTYHNDKDLYYRSKSCRRSGHSSRLWVYIIRVLYGYPSMLLWR